MNILFQRATEKFLMLYYYMKTPLYCKKTNDGAYIKKLQNRKLKRILKRAYSTELYRKKFDESGLLPQDIKSVDDLYKFPVLTKEEYRDYIDGEVQKNPDKYKKWLTDHTSGSTGMPLYTKYTPYEHAAEMGKVFKVYMHNGHHVFKDTKMAITSPTHATTETRSFIQKLGLAKKYRMSQLDAPFKWVEKLNRVKPDLLNANMSHIISMIEYAEQEKIDLYVPQIVVSTAEKMSKDKAALLQKYFGNHVVDVYGCIENGIIAYTLRSDINKHYVLNEYNYFFVLDSDNKLADKGKIYLTSLFSKGFPLINYQLGDIVDTYVENGIRYIKEINGRADDWIKFRDGSKVPFQHIYEIMSDLGGGVIKYRVVQESYDELIINVVRRTNTSYSKDFIEQTIMDRAKKILPQNKIKIKVNWVKTIEVEQNGKIRMLISKV